MTFNAPFVPHLFFSLSTILLLACPTIVLSQPKAFQGSHPQLHLVKDIVGGSASSFPSFFTELSGKLYFTAGPSIFDSELYSSDFTASGTGIVFDALPGAGGTAGDVRTLGGSIIYLADTPQGKSLLISDGTVAGTSVVSTFAVAQSLSEEIDGVVYFGAGTQASGLELYRSDGTPSGTYQLADLLPGPLGSNPTGFQELPNEPGVFIFKAGLPPMLYRSDGSTSGTVPFSSATGRSFTPFKGKLFYWGFTLSHGHELWMTDGSPGGTQRITDINPGPGFSAGSNQFLIPMKGDLFFAAIDASGDTELWKSDGTSSGTQRVKDIFPGGGSSNPQHFVRFGSRKFYFSATHPNFGRELWESDGTSQGTRLVHDLYPGPMDGIVTTNPTNHPNARAIRIKNRLLIEGRLSTTGRELFQLVDPARALASGIGYGCGSPGLVPRCEATDPVLGGVTTITCENIPPNHQAFLMLGTPAPYPLPLTPQCEVFLDLGASLAVLDSWTQAVPGSHSVTVPLPNTLNLTGLEFTVQLVLFPSQGGGVFVSNGIELILGS